MGQKTVTINGRKFVYIKGVITALVINCGTVTIKRGQKVQSNGRIFTPNGTPGKIVRIHNPEGKGLTSDVLEVKFRGYKNTYMMKSKDLILNPQAST
ncbi:MAG: hypothetical protein WCW02_03165 [Candidatus Buchananbacteria bacterium]